MDNSWPVVASKEPARTRRLSVEEWLLLDENDDGELVDGLLAEEEVPDFAHELAVSWLIRVLGAWLAGRGFVVGSELKLLLPGGRGRKADVVVLLPESKAPPRTGPLRQPPDILVEVVTPTPRDQRRDRIEKMSDYAEFGVPYYWLVDPTLRAFEIFGRTERGTYEKVAAATTGRIDEVPGCLRLSLDIDALWAELDRLDTTE